MRWQINGEVKSSSLGAFRMYVEQGIVLDDTPVWSDNTSCTTPGIAQLRPSHAHSSAPQCRYSHAPTRVELPLACRAGFDPGAHRGRTCAVLGWNRYCETLPEHIESSVSARVDANEHSLATSRQKVPSLARPTALPARQARGLTAHVLLAPGVHVAHALGCPPAATT